MNRHFDIPADRHDLPVSVLRRLWERAAELNLPVLLVGAAARDLVASAVIGKPPTRATHDVDIAVAVPAGDAFTAFTSTFTRTQSVHKVKVEGVDVDIVPFGAIETRGEVHLDEGHALNVVGMAESMAQADRITLAPGLTIRCASLESLSGLKIIAWRDRRRISTKDAVDLRTLLDAASDPPYSDETWDDVAALEACDYMIDHAGAYRLGRDCARSFSPDRGAQILHVLHDATTRSDLIRDMHALMAADYIDAYSRGYSVGLGGPSDAHLPLS